LLKIRTEKQNNLREIIEDDGDGDTCSIDRVRGSGLDTGEVIPVGVTQKMVSLPTALRAPGVHREREPLGHFDGHGVSSLFQIVSYFLILAFIPTGGEEWTLTLYLLAPFPPFFFLAEEGRRIGFG
jgi:hypothetical protein